MKHSEFKQLIREEIHNFPGKPAHLSIPQDTYDMIDGSVNERQISLFLKSASLIMQDLTQGEYEFDTKDVFDYLYSKMLEEV